MKKLITSGVLAAFVATTAGAGVVAAQSADAEVAVTETMAIEIALAEVPGEVQETELEQEDGKQLYEVEILTADGKEMEVEIDAQTGAIVMVEAEDANDEDDDDNEDGEDGEDNDKDDVDTDKS